MERIPTKIRGIYEDITAGMKPEAVMKKHGVTAKAVGNALDRVRSYLTTVTKAASAEGLKPNMKDGMIDGGRPDLAYGAEPQFAAVDQIRNESDVPGHRPWVEVMAQAEKRLRADYAAAHDDL